MWAFILVHGASSQQDDENLLRITLARCLQKFVDAYENIYHEE